MGFGTGVQVGFEMLEALANSEGIFMSAMQNKALVGKGGFEGLGVGRQGVPHKIGFESVGSPLSGRRTNRGTQNRGGRVGYAAFTTPISLPVVMQTRFLIGSSPSRLHHVWVCVGVRSRVWRPCAAG